MSNLILNLQNGLKNTSIYKDIQNEEIINLIHEYNNNPHDFIDYKNYFNEKCIEDYKFFLVSNIINRIEKTFSKKQIYGNNGILENKMLFLFLKYKKNIPNFISKLNINEENFLQFIPEVKELKQKINIFKDLNKDVSKFKKELDVYRNNIFDIIATDIKIYLDNVTNLKNDFDIKFNDNISSLLKTFVKYCVKNNKKFINIKINYKQWNDLIITKFSDYQYENLDDMINDFKSNELINSQELSYLITKYKIVINQNFQTFIDDFDDIILNSDLINNYRELKFQYQDPQGSLNDNPFDDSPSPQPIRDVQLEKNINKHIFIEIVEICEQPFSQTYLDYLENIYQQLDKMNIFNNIKEKNTIQNELIIEYENQENTFIKDIIKKIKNNNDNLNHYILKKSINHNLNREDYNDLKKEVQFFKDLFYKDNKNGIFNNFILNNIQNILTELTEFNLIVDINTVEKHLKNNPVDEQNEYIQSQIQKYFKGYNLTKKEKNLMSSTEKKNYIFISTHSFFKNNNFFNFINFMKDLEKKINFFYDPEINREFVDIFNGFLSEFFNHYIKCINNYHIIDLHPSARQLYYNYKDNSKIRVYINDPIQEILFKIKNNPKKYEYTFQKLLNHLFNYKYYNINLDIDETIIDKVKNDIFLIRYINLIQQINQKLDKPFIPKVIKIYQKMINKANEEEIEIKGALKQIVDFNKKNPIISVKGIQFLIQNSKDLNFLTFQKIINKKKKTIQDKIQALKFIKLFVEKVDKELKEKKINIYRDNHNQKQKKIIHDTSKELNRIFKSSDPFPYKYVAATTIKQRDFFDNYKVDISNIKSFVKNDMTFIEINNFRNAYKENKNENIYLNLMNNTIEHNKKFLNNKFNQQFDFQILYKNLFEDLNKIKIISKKFHKNINSKDFFKKINYTKKTFSDIISLISILFFFDNLINYNIDFDLKSFEEKKQNSIINKKIYILKTGLISNIKSKKDDFYFDKKNIKLKRNDFILYDSLINQNVTIIKGNFKGYIGRLMQLNDLKNFSFNTKENKKNQKKHIENLNNNINDLERILIKLKNGRLYNAFDDLELNELIKFRTELLRTKATQNLFRNYLGKKIKLDVKYEFNIKINPSNPKIFNDLEISLIKKFRLERIKNITHNVNILKKQKEHFIQKHKQQFYIRINEGEKSAKNIMFSSDEFKFNKDDILNREIKKEHLIHFQNLIIQHKYDNLYDFSKYVFNFNNISDKNDEQYFINIYKEAIKIFNINKKNNMNLVNIKISIDEDLRKLNKNIKILTKHSDKGKKIDKLKLKKWINMKNIRDKKLIKINHDINKFNLIKFNSLKNNKFTNDINIIDSVSYFKVNNFNMKEDIKNIKINKKKIKEYNLKQQEIDNEKLKKLFYDIKQDLDYVIDDILNDNSKLTFIDYINSKFFDDDDEDISIDYDDILQELDELDIESDFDERVDQREREIGRPLTWLEINNF